MLRFLGFLFAAGTILFIVGVAAIVRACCGIISKDLPDYSQLQDYEPPVMTRVHAADGSLLAEYAKEHRLYLPIQAIPKLVTNAFVAAEDKNFYQHPGIDIYGIMRAGMLYVENYGSSRRPQGASTITQQVAKNFLLTNEVSFERKIKEALLALRIERTYSKQKILELYLNEIYLGFGAYGVAAASLLYFDKSVHELTIARGRLSRRAAEGPEQLQSVPPSRRGGARRNYVIDRMAEDGYITAADADAAKKSPLERHGAADRRAHFRGRVFRRRSAALSLRQLRREEALRGRPVGAHHARSQAADVGAPGHDQRAGQLRREPRLPRAGQHYGRQRRLGRQARRCEVACRISIPGGWRWCSKWTTSRRGSVCSRRAIRAAPSLKDREIGIVPLDGVKWAKPATGPAKPIQHVNQVLSAGDVDLCRSAPASRANTGCARCRKSPAPWW